MKGTRGKHWQKGELEMIARELRQRVDAAWASGKPPVVDWPSDREMPLKTQRLYATLNVLVRFRLTPHAPCDTVTESPKE